MSSSNCCFLTCIQVSQEAGQVLWYSHLLKNIHSLLWSTQSKDLAKSTKQMFFWNSLAFSMTQWMLALWSLVPLPFLKPVWTSVITLFTYCISLAWRIEHYFAGVWDESNCVVVWTCFGIAFLWDWNENWPFPVLRLLPSFPNLLAIECSTFTASYFRIWNSSTGIPSLPLALFVVMLSKAHLTSHSRISGSRWVITPSWLSGLWSSFLYDGILLSH